MHIGEEGPDVERRRVLLVTKLPGGRLVLGGVEEWGLKRGVRSAWDEVGTATAIMEEAKTVEL